MIIQWSFNNEDTFYALAVAILRVSLKYAESDKPYGESRYAADGMRIATRRSSLFSIGSTGDKVGILLNLKLAKSTT